jgi:hypothetical protein
MKIITRQRLNDDKIIPTIFYNHDWIRKSKQISYTKDEIYIIDKETGQKRIVSKRNK